MVRFCVYVAYERLSQLVTGFVCPSRPWGNFSLSGRVGLVTRRSLVKGSRQRSWLPSGVCYTLSTYVHGVLVGIRVLGLYKQV